MGPQSYRLSVVDRNVVMRRMTVIPVAVLRCGSFCRGSADRGFSSAVLWASSGRSDLMH